MKNLMSLTFLICFFSFSNTLFSQESQNPKIIIEQNQISTLNFEINNNQNYVLIPGKYLSSEELKQIHRLINDPGRPHYQITPLFCDEDFLIPCV